MTPTAQQTLEENNAYINKVLDLIRQKPNQTFSIDIDACNDDKTVAFFQRNCAFYCVTLRTAQLIVASLAPHCKSIRVVYPDAGDFAAGLYQPYLYIETQ